MNTEAERQIKLRQGAVAWQAVDGEAILLDLDNSLYLGLNETATVLWPAIVEGTTRSDLVARLSAEYDLPPERAASDVDDFVATCESRNLLEP